MSEQMIHHMLLYSIENMLLDIHIRIPIDINRHFEKWVWDPVSILMQPAHDNMHNRLEKKPEEPYAKI